MNHCWGEYGNFWLFEHLVLRPDELCLLAMVRAVAIGTDTPGRLEFLPVNVSKKLPELPFYDETMPP
jgi:hypothetical protein